MPGSILKLNSQKQVESEYIREYEGRGI